MRSDQTVFISSTFRDLEHHRRAVIDAIHDLRSLRVMKSRGATPGTPAENCLRWVRKSDVYVGIIGMCYGSRESGSGVSFTELEYDEAMRLNLPCLVYMIDEERHQLLPVSVDRGQDAVDLERFKAKVRAKNCRGLFRSSEHLRYQVARDIINLFDEKSRCEPESGDSPVVDSAVAVDGWRIQLCAWGSLTGRLNVIWPSGDEDSSEADIAASILISRFARGDYSNLNGIVSLKPSIRNSLRSFLSIRDLDESALAKEIRNAEVRSPQGVLYARQLIDLAGLAASKECVEVICQTVLYEGRDFDNDLQIIGFGYEIRSYTDVCVEALGRMPQSYQHLIIKYVEKARTTKNWQAKRIFEKSLKRISTQLCSK